MSVLDELHLDHANEALQRLVSLFVDSIDDRDRIRALAKSAEVKTGRLYFNKPLDLLWWDLLDEARRQDRQWHLVEKIKEELPAAGKQQIDALRGAPPKVKPLPARWKGGVERQTGRHSTLLDISFLEKGLHAARSVVHLSVSCADGTTADGTGFLIGRDLLLSNHHVLFDPSNLPSTSVVARFRYEEGVKEILRVCRPETLQGDPDYDWAVVQLREPAPDEIPIVRMAAPSSPVRLGFPAFIIQHPNGGRKKIGLYRNEVRFVDEDVVQYLTDTEVGSSGSPVFDERWEIIALHHRWVPGDEANAAGIPVKVLNQGVRIERVIAGLAARGLL